MKLFKYEGYEVKVAPEALLLSPFKKIWNRDKSKDKTKAMSELGFIYFYSDPRSDYQYIIDEEDRLNAVKEGEGFDKDWKPDDAIMAAVEFYEKFQPTSALLLEDTRVATDKLRRKLRDIDLDETDDKGRPLYTLNSITQTIKQVPQLVKELAEAERLVNEQIKEQGTARGSVEKTLFDDGLDNI
jgi:hypothetical protein